MGVLCWCWWASLLFLVPVLCSEETVSKVDPDTDSLAKDRRYLHYDVNPGEGMNLRRDVHMRVANVVRQLREKGENFVLVLPPWGASYHWQSKELGHQIQIPWGLWYDLPSLNRFVPSIEFADFSKETGVDYIDHVYYLQHYAEGWGKGWEEKWHYRPCINGDDYYEVEPDTGKILGWFWGYSGEMYAKKMDCISIQGQSSSLLPLLLSPNQTSRSIMIDRAETVLHDFFGDVYYWQARRSMRYAKALRDIADEYRQTELNSNDVDDKTVLHEDWTKMKVNPGDAVGGPYLAVHWRRKDFVRSHAKDIPSIKGTAQQIIALLKKLDLTTVFIATDGKKHDVEELRSLLPEEYVLKTYAPSTETLKKYKDGGISIIDQWICAHAKYFIGSHVSTFSFRIQDDREILGFLPHTSFNRLCPDDDADCEQPAHWKIVY